MRAKHCVVVGAGLAGLAAAYKLVQMGWTVEVLEADERIGGRVFTLKVDRKQEDNGKGKRNKNTKGKKRAEQEASLFFELGGEWVGLDHNRMIALCREFDLKLMWHRFSFSFWEKGIRSEIFKPGRLPFSKKANNAFNKYRRLFNKLDDCQEQNLDQVSWWSKLQELGFGPSDLDKRDLMDSTDFGESIRFTSAFVGGAEYYNGDKGRLTDQMDKKIDCGNALLPIALANKIEETKRGVVYVKKYVKGIEQKNGRVKVTTTDAVRPKVPRTAMGTADRKTTRRNVFMADACICAVPALQLQEIEWDPPLPKDQSDAARELQYARIMKTAIYFKEKFWKPEKEFGFSLFTNRASDFVFESTFGQKGPEGVLCSYAIGDKADDLADEKHEDKAMWIGDDVCDAVDVARRPAKYLHHKAWQKDECIGGAYAFYKPGQWFTVRPILSRPHKLVAFAGEHLSDSWQGFMEGAVETGEAAADNLSSLIAKASS